MRIRMSLGLAAIALLLAAGGPAFAKNKVKVKKVDDYRYKCTYSSGGISHVTAGNRAEAIDRCKLAAPAGQSYVSIEELGPATTAAESKEATPTR